jgi:hypothetical protein
MRSQPINDLEQAAFWYELYWDADGGAKGYAAFLLHGIEIERGNDASAERWLQRCQETDYEGCLLRR